MKLSISNIAWEDAEDKKVYEIMKKYGFLGLEIAPTRWVKETPYDKVDEAKQIAEELENTYGYCVPSMQSIWFGRNERVFANEEERGILLAYTKKAIDYAAGIKCKNLVFGCPKSRNVPEEWQLSEDEVWKQAITFFKELGDYANEKGTVLAMEANPPIYNTNFVNTTEQALELVKAVNSKGFLLNLDIGTMVQNKEDTSILKDNVKLINHVHVSEPGLKVIQKRELHKQIAEILKNENYEKFVSIEIGKQDSVEQIEECMKYVAEVFHE